MLFVVDIFYRYLSALCLIFPTAQLWAEAGLHHEVLVAHRRELKYRKNQDQQFLPFFSFFFASFVHFVVQKKHR